jgi:hypothetical protein
MTCDPRFYPGTGPGGSVPPVSAATFSALPSIRPDGYLVTVTAESGLSADTIVQWDESGGVWLLVSTACAYTVHRAVEWVGLGEWYDTGGVTVETANGATIYDTTYDVSLRWHAATVQFVPPDVYDGTIAGLQSMSGASAAPAGWTALDTDAGGTASLTSDGTKITLSATTSGAGTTVARYSYNDASIASGSNVYIRLLCQVTTLTPASIGNAWFRVAIRDGARSYDFGSASTQALASPGRFFSTATVTAFAEQSAYVQPIASAETLVEIRKIGQKCEARAGGATSTWAAIANTTAVASALQSVAIDVAAAITSGTSTVVATIRDLRSMRY